MKCRVMAVRAVGEEEMQIGIMPRDSCCSPFLNQSPAELKSPERTLNLGKNKGV